VDRVTEYEQKFLAHLRSNERPLLEQIAKEGSLSQDLENKIKSVIDDFLKGFL
jgi:F-type H+-transporting ATPase subunit alpha